MSFLCNLASLSCSIAESASAMAAATSTACSTFNPISFCSHFAKHLRCKLLENRSSVQFTIAKTSIIQKSWHNNYTPTTQHNSAVRSIRDKLCAHASIDSQTHTFQASTVTQTAARSIQLPLVPVHTGPLTSTAGVSARVVGQLSHTAARPNDLRQ